MKKFSYGEVVLVPIVGDGALATSSIGVGRFIPCLILDTSGRNDISKLLKANPSQGVVDSRVQWGRPFTRRDIIFLRITFFEPIESDFHIKFDVLEHGILVETILNNKAVILFEGNKEDSVSEKLTNNEDNILTEVPDTNYKDTWRKIWKGQLVKKYKGQGYSRSQAKNIADSIINEIESFKHIQI